MVGLIQEVEDGQYMSSELKICVRIFTRRQGEPFGSHLLRYARDD